MVDDGATDGGRGASGRVQVLVAGAGVAGVETALALRAFAGPAVRVRLVDPGRWFRIPATATARAFGPGGPVEHPLVDVAARAGAELVAARIEAVDPARRLVLLAGGAPLAYDALIVAVGARAEPSVPGALSFRGHADAAAARGMVDDIAQAAERGRSTRMAVVVPEGGAWALAGYELALMAREHLVAAGAADRVEVTVVTAEAIPLAPFGARAAATVARMLARADVRVSAATAVRGWRWGALQLADGRELPADRVIALPTLRGPAIEGLPCDERGFVRVAADNSVPGARDVWAVGDGSTSPMKHGGVACRQADAVAAAIAGRVGGDPAGADAEGARVAPAAPLWPVPKVAGRFLTPFLQRWPEPAPAGAVSTGAADRR
ncbi:NAD(P)/FAD-dependent oxidoreductase [Miltoncostaea marina]|uniref:NAD(P)/FAD-dependent oxidoreductase n=1 Tax=Miltoncostaea marina TaxID=2843215 RepID=UPI001C3E1B2B|nr:FAD-dependent oxidoreductase [Miltoncostaea marina]